VANQSITLLPSDRQDAEALSRSLQTTVDAVNTIVGVAPSQLRLSTLEVIEPQLNSVSGLAAASVESSSSIEALSKRVTDLSAKLEALVEQVETTTLAFGQVPSFNFNSTNWSIAQGSVYGTSLGSGISNPPAGVTISGAATYSVYSEVKSLGAFWQTLQLVGNSQNRVFVRAGATFAAAVSAGWKEL
jgi:hypothetical protein